MLSKQLTSGTLPRCHACVIPFRHRIRPVTRCVAQPTKPNASQQQFDLVSKAGLAGVGLLAPFIYEVGSALATEGQFGILEGRTAALIHPLVMVVLFGTTVYAGWLGWQWRRTRTIGNDIKALKAQVPKVPVMAGDAAPAPAPTTELDRQIAALEQERKDLVAGGYRDKHYYTGALLLGFGTVIAIEGCLNTWFRTGKLFPGPHLFAGAGIVALWAAAAALVPAMQKGDDNARNAHIALNALNLTLFAWQLPTGWEIVLKVFQFTSWP
eukprot:jgi/Chrzof1/10988/Cz05g19210.t1